jgi:hypothetical protein
MGTILSILICLPSLYIFTCLSGIDAQLRTVTGVLFAAVSLGALLLIGFAPIALDLFTINDSVAFMAALAHWSVGDWDHVWFASARSEWAICSAVPRETI